MQGDSFETAKHFSGSYQDIFQDLGWQLIRSESFIFGELEVKEISTLHQLYK